MKIKDKVLIVEDEQSISNFISMILTANGFDTIIVRTGEEALTMIASHCPDMIVLDLGLPDMDGMEVLKSVRKWSNLPVVVVSARNHEHDKVEALDYGADDYLVKPFGTSELLARIRTAIRHTRTTLSNTQIAQSGKFVTGDLTITGGVKQAEMVMDVLRAHNPRIWAQIGNMDRPEVDEWLSGLGCNLHTQVHELTPDTAIFGIGASTFTPFGTPSEFPESTFAGWLENSWQKARKYPHTVLVSHNPPKDSACDVIPGNIHVGSTAVREFLEEAQPDVCLCGHIHEARAVDRVGRTIVVNPGALAQGGYVLLRSSGGKSL